MANPWEMPPPMDPGMGGTVYTQDPFPQPDPTATYPWPPEHWSLPPEEAPPPPWMVSGPPPPAPAPAVAPPPAPGGGPVPPELGLAADEAPPPDVVSAAAPILPRGAPPPAMQAPAPAAPPRPPDALAQEEGARISQATIGQKYATQKADVLQQRQAAEDRLVKEEDARATAWETDLKNEAKNLQGARIDRRRIFKEAGIGGSLAMLGGAILNGFIAPLQGGRNQALEIVQHAVDQDIASQESDLANRRAALGAEQGLYSQYLAQTGDRRKARTLATVAALDSIDKQMAAEQALYDSDLIKADIQKKRDAIAAAQGEAIGKARQQEFENGLAVRKQVETERAQRVGEKLQASSVAQGWSRLKQDREQFDKDLAFKYSALKQEGKDKEAEALRAAGAQVVFGVQGASGERVVAPDKEVAAKLNEGIGQAEEAYQGLERLTAMRKEHGWEREGLLLSSDEAKAMRSLHANIITKLKEAAKLGAISGPDMELMVNQIGDDPRGLIDNTPKWEEARKSIKLGVQSQVKNRTGQAVNWDPKVHEEGFTPGGKVTQKSAGELEGEAGRRMGAQGQRLEEQVYGQRPAAPAAPAATPPRSSLERLYYGE